MTFTSFMKQMWLHIKEARNERDTFQRTEKAKVMFGI